jgi:TonB family protein
VIAPQGSRQLRRRKSLRFEHSSLHDHTHLRSIALVALLVALALGGLWRGDARTPAAAGERAVLPAQAQENSRNTAASPVMAQEPDYLPLVTVAPEYPAAAEAAGISGRCTVEFTVTAAGTTRDVRPVDCNPPGAFEAAAVAAARQFKYRPRERAGLPVDVAGVRNEFVFSLER